MAIGFKRNETGSKFSQSVSGWERSWFGGYSRLIYDHPHIHLDPKIKINPSSILIQDLGIYAAEKLLKIYLLQLNETGSFLGLTHRVEVRKDWMGNEKKFDVYLLDSLGVFESITSHNRELSPLFSKYANGIWGSSIEIEISENQETSDGGGSDEEDEKNKEGGGNPSESEAENKKALGVLEEALSKTKVWEPYKPNKISNFDGKPAFIPLEDRPDYRFSKEEIKNAEFLTKLLDISFDPKSDIVKSLRIGKLDASKIAEVPAGNISVYQQRVEEQDTRPFSVCILADMSGSMMGSKERTQLSVLNSLFLSLSEILPADKLFIYGHSGVYSPEIYTFYSPYEQQYEKKIGNYEMINFSENYDGPVVEAIHKKIRSITDDRVIFISLSDGQPAGRNYGGHTDCEDLKRILERCRRDDFVTVGIGIKSFHVEGLYSYSKVVEDLRDMPKDVSTLINRVVRTEFK